MGGVPALQFSWRVPRTIEAFRSIRGIHGDRRIAQAQRIPVRPREAGVLWHPRRYLAGLPALVDEFDLDHWLAAAAAGLEVAYHLGSLALDRIDNPSLDHLARAVLARSQAEILNVTPAPCGHLRGAWKGSGDLEPAQRRLPGGQWLYLVVRR
ncbi:MAG: hypothetical protein AB7I59_05420 [Geminicoccaceae bacterium]